jgi:hypothetical protein
MVVLPSVWMVTTAGDTTLTMSAYESTRPPDVRIPGADWAALPGSAKLSDVLTRGVAADRSVEIRHAAPKTRRVAATVATTARVTGRPIFQRGLFIAVSFQGGRRPAVLYAVLDRATSN